MSDHKLGRDVFLALAAVGWADGRMAPDEADALVKTALDDGLEIEEIEEIEKATKNPVQLTSIDISGMSKADRLFVYAVAAWMTRVDGAIDEKELAALDKIGDLLKIPEGPRARADEIAQEVAGLDEDDKPLHFDVKKLRETIGRRLTAEQKANAEKAADK